MIEKGTDTGRTEVASKCAKGDKMRWVRAVISIIGILGITAGFFMRLISTEAYLTITSVSVAWWFKSRDEEKQNGNSSGK